MTRISAFTGGFSGYRAISRSLALAGGSEFTGSTMMFMQTAAPTGWTKLTTDNDTGIRVVSGTASSGGTVAFSSLFSTLTPTGTTSPATIGAVGSTTLSTPQIGTHSHTASHQGAGPVLIAEYGTPTSRLRDGRLTNSGTQGSGTSHTHPSPGESVGTSFVGTGLDFNIKYVDVILATKN